MSTTKKTQEPGGKYLANVKRLEAKIAQINKELAAIGSKESYRNPQNYTYKINQLRSKYKLGRNETLTTLLTRLNKEVSENKKVMSMRYVANPRHFFLSEKLPAPSNVKHTGYDFNPYYNPKYDPTSEQNLQGSGLKVNPKDRSITVNGVKVFPNNIYYKDLLSGKITELPKSEKKSIQKKEPIPLEVKVKENNLNGNTPVTKSIKPKPQSLREQEVIRNNTIENNSASREQTNTSLAESGGKTDLTIKGYNAPHPQVGTLMINPGGWVGRNADVRLPNNKSTTLSIAQADFGRIKKGENLGVLTKRQRARYDREVLGLG